jgi:hypothetical protein
VQLFLVVVSFMRLGSRSHIKIQCRVNALAEWGFIYHTQENVGDLVERHSCVFDATVVQLETTDVFLRRE